MLNKIMQEYFYFFGFFKNGARKALFFPAMNAPDFIALQF